MEGLAVVVPAVTGYPNLAKTLKALERERQSFALDVFVVSRLGDDFARHVSEFFPWCRVLTVNKETPIPQMRLVGAQAGRQHEYTAMLEDHVTVPPGWAARMVSVAKETGAVVAGPLSNGATGSVVSQAAFLCEYSHCLPPQAAGERSWLPGNNTTYKSSLLGRYSGVLAEGRWEDALHRAIVEGGGALWMDPDLEALHDLAVTRVSYLRDRYHYSRAFAGARLRGAPLARRMWYAAGCFPLPVVLLARIFGRSFARKRYRSLVVLSLPLLTLFVVAWAAGEFVGYLAGPGNALSKVR